ncbi:hypothetical protein PALB_30710 [Pseudoalteromonas luteoviolacea B = ATCC 29581]|nr:hypothetical protein PALB_30710 [Pseudoalteromonas luteoviolacea B = ATCC 29581]
MKKYLPFSILIVAMCLGACKKDRDPPKPPEDDDVGGASSQFESMTIEQIQTTPTSIEHKVVRYSIIVE